MNHNFTKNYYSDKFISWFDDCIICGKSVALLHDILTKNNMDTFIYIKNRTYKTDFEIYNKYIPCLTDDEFLIKNIIE